MKFCTNCGKENADNCTYCSACGTYLKENEFENGQTANNFSSQYNSNTYVAMPQPPVTKTKIIVALVLGALFGGMIGLIFAVLALIAYSDYENAMARNDFTTAKLKCEKIKTYNTVAWVFDIIGIVLVSLAIIAAIAMFILSAVGIWSISSGDIPTDFFEFDEPEIIREFTGLAMNLISKI